MLIENREDLTWFNSDTYNASFIATGAQFLDNPLRGRVWVEQNLGRFLGPHVVQNHEVIYQKNKHLDKFKDSKILIVGGGPTTNDINWDPDDYDYIWSMNHFYLNEKLQDCHVSLVSVSSEVDLRPDNTKFYNYARKHKTLICFENCDRPGEEVLRCYNAHSGRCFYALTRYNSKIGATPRLMCLAVLLGAKEIHVVGMDGYPEGVKIGDDSHHSFQPEKKMQGMYDHKIYKQLYKTLWDYLINKIGKDVVFKNLGEGHPYNMSTGITKEYSSLDSNKKIEDIAIIVQARLSSERVPQKMIKPFGDTTLMDVCLEKLSKSIVIPKENVYIVVHEPKLFKLATKYNFNIFHRSERSAMSEGTPMTEIYEWHDKIPHKYCVLINACAPFLKIETIDDFIHKFLQSGSRGMFGVMEKKDYFWGKDGNMITSCEEAVMNTKTADTMYQAAHCLYGSRLDTISDGIWMGTFEKSDPELYVMQEDECFDIDWPFQFKQAEILYKAGWDQ